MLCTDKPFYCTFKNNNTGYILGLMLTADSHIFLFIKLDGNYKVCVLKS